MNRQHAFAAFDERHQRPLLRRRQRGVVAVNHQRVIVRELFRNQRLFRREHVRELNAPPRERRRDDGEHRR
jgi:hypothetical protein